MSLDKYTGFKFLISDSDLQEVVIFNVMGFEQKLFFFFLIAHENFF